MNTTQSRQGSRSGRPSSSHRTSRGGSQSNSRNRSGSRSGGFSRSNSGGSSGGRRRYSSGGGSQSSSGGGYKGSRSSGSRGGGSRGGGSRGGNRGGSRGGRKMSTFDPSKFINTNPVDVKEIAYTAKNTFKTFGLIEKFVENITKMGLITPSPIQDQIIPEILNGNDVIGLAETGTGKTAAFLIPLIEKTLKDNNRETLILAPTRELAIQIEEELQKLTRGFRLFSVVCVGGINIRPQIKALRLKNNFVIGTPGRVLDLINRKNIKPENFTTVVLDEADRMLDMGFINDMRKILENTPKDRETLFFSATMDKQTEKLVNDFMNDPVTISVKKKDVTNSIEQNVINFNEDTKFETLVETLRGSDFKRVIVFGARKHAVEKLSRALGKSGISSESIHGNKSHGQRQNSLTKFKNGKSRVLVATDVAARGIHVDNVTHVINYDLPGTFEDYVHRIGRTGRAEQRGKALTFVPMRKASRY